MIDEWHPLPSSRDRRDVWLSIKYARPEKELPERRQIHWTSSHPENAGCYLIEEAPED